MKRILLLFTWVMIFHSAIAQDDQTNIKLNTGLVFSRTGNDLANVADENHLGLFISAEKPLFTYTYLKQQDLGVTLAGVLGQEGHHLLANSRLTKIDVSITSLRGRIYLLSSPLGPVEFVEKLSDEFVIGIFPFDLIANFLYVISINSLHFDLGTGVGLLHETAFIDDYPFEPEKNLRMMLYSGWGLQPQIFQSDNDKWIVNAVFDFGRFSWKNSGGGVSSISANYIGFGARYTFK